MTHGTRTCYQQTRCRCVDCRGAEAVYRQRLRRIHRDGRAPFGTIMPAKEAHRLIAKLRAERFTTREIAKHLGLKRRLYTVHPDRIRLRTLLKLRRLVRLYVQEQRDRDQPNV